MPLLKHKKLLNFFAIILFCGLFFFTYQQLTAIGQLNLISVKEALENEDIKQINRQIEEKKEKLLELEKRQAEFKNLIAQKRIEQQTLNNQIELIDNRIAEAQFKIDQINLEIDKTELEIKRLNFDIADKSEKIRQEKEQISAALRLIYKQDNRSQLEIILLNDNISQFIDEIKSLENLNREISVSLDQLKEAKTNLEKDKNELVAKMRELEDLQQSLNDSKISMITEKENKNYLLLQTKSSEAEYQRLLAQAKAEQERASADIYSLEKKMREKLSEAKLKQLKANSSKGFIWPVASQKITAYFHDPDYPYRYIFEHPAIDIKASQGTAVKAAASGYVARAKNAGMGYSYIMIVHADGLATVYGHVSKIYVTEDEYVSQGQIIGLSGGAPGTPGAGNLTTGPHLHFEVRLNGIPVDPLGYLP